MEKVAEFYVVGGFVRDTIMGFTPKDRDYVVVGVDESYMLKKGFKQVGVGFPVFLNEIEEEFALARRERSTGDGYNNFEVEVSGVTLEEDLKRRDLTINSIAKDLNGNIIDPFNGISDIENKVFRQTSDAFMEDPVRVLRVARLRARFGHEWTLHKDLIAMCSTMSKKGVMDSLDGHRIWKELSRALMEPHPRLFFDTLLELDCLHTVFPDIYKLLTALESMRWHPEGNAYEHTMLVLTQAAINGYDLTKRFACLVHDIGKGLTKFEHLPKHYGHDVNGSRMIPDFCEKYKVPHYIRDIAIFTTKHHMKGHNILTLNPKTLVKMFGESKSIDFITTLHAVFVCDERGRKGYEKNDVEFLSDIFHLNNAYNSVKFIDVFPNGQTDVEKIKSGLYNARTKSLSEEKKRLTTV